MNLHSEDQPPRGGRSDGQEGVVLEWQQEEEGLGRPGSLQRASTEEEVERDISETRRAWGPHDKGGDVVDGSSNNYFSCFDQLKQTKEERGGVELCGDTSH